LDFHGRCLDHPSFDVAVLDDSDFGIDDDALRQRRLMATTTTDVNGGNQNVASM